MLVKDLHGRDTAYDFSRACYVAEDQPGDAFIAPVPPEELPQYTCAHFSVHLGILGAVVYCPWTLDVEVL